ncbi:MAG: O-antigen ligase family protein [Thermoleophilaceae bacterium]
MATRPVPLLSTPGPVAGAGVLAALLVGVLMAAAPPYGIGLVLALCFVPLALVDLPLSLAIWVALTLFDRVPFVWIGPTAAALMVLLAWLGTLRNRRTSVARVVHRHRRLLGVVALLLVWMGMSALWAEDQVRVGTETVKWCVAAAGFLVVATTVDAPRHLRVLLAAFVAGAVVSVALGVADAVVQQGFALEEGGRLKGGGGDANYLAAGLIPAAVLAGALAGATRNPLLRLVAWSAAAIIAAGVAATQSRGGMIAVVVAVVAALVVLRHRRSQVVAFVLVVALGGGAWFAAYPEAWTRVVDTQSGSTGRADLWTVGWRMFRDHPVVGVGLHNYAVRAEDYVREPGSLEAVELIADDPHEAHNVFLGVLAETGVVGLALYLAVLSACLAAAYRSMRAFESLGERALADLSGAVVVAMVAALSASAFIPNGGDKRLWVLLGLGPAMLLISTRWTRDEPGAVSRGGERAPRRRSASRPARAKPPVGLRHPAAGKAP